MPEPRASAFDWNQARLEHWDNLPHVRQENVIYFLTFRLGDALPTARVASLQAQRDAWLADHPLLHTPEEKLQYRRLWTVRIEQLLDAGHGACVLRDSECRQLLEDAMRHDDGRGYRLGEFVIMPNHVHVLLHMLPGQDLSVALKAWKSVSARKIGKRLRRPGSYWMDETFDHAVRQGASLERFVRYIRRNPRYLPPGDFTLGCGSMVL